jgi:tetratricopeptide (TPR) repeat protein
MGKRRKQERENMRKDARGLAMTTSSDAAATSFDTAVHRSLEFRLDTMDHVNAMLEADSDFVLGNAMKGFLMLGMQSQAVTEPVLAICDFCESRADSLTDREKGWVAALRPLAMNNKKKALAIMDQILVEDPNDLFMLRQQHHGLFWSGKSMTMRDAVARALTGWSRDMPGYGFALGMQAFGYEESNQYQEAERYARRAHALNPDDPWAVHCVAHVMEMQGRLDEGADWLERPLHEYTDRNAFMSHLSWHQALFYLEASDYDRVLANYDTLIYPKPSTFYIEIQNASSLLWRLTMNGVDVGNRWEVLADTVEETIDDHVLGFSDTHVTVALAAVGKTQSVARQIDSFHEHAKTPDNNAAELAESLTIPVAEAIAAGFAGDNDRATDLLLQTRDDWVKNGASHAQRDLYNLALLDAASKAGRTKLARALAAERVRMKPNSQGNWLKYAATLDAEGQTAGAADARARAAAVVLN